MKTLIIIPARDAADNLGDLIPRIRVIINDIVVIDDGSSDQTAVAASDYGAIVIRHKINRGKGAALKTGFTFALNNGFDAVVTIDSDGQHNPDDIPRFMRAFNESGADMIIGSRKNDKGLMSWPRRFSNWSTSRLLSIILKKEIEDSQCGFRLLSRRLLESIELEYDRFELETEMIIKAVRAGLKIEFLPIKSEYGKNHKTYMRPFADTIRWCRAVLKLI